ncbi:glycosyltransferase [uncultured Bifidobacterium sp.]|uniref:glycosyltransferase n=1 Tax=uncultured Bifidobacterium sp. TaxID=165187 RepID=UPI002629F847|nr:glycosyltransferase [uncultured Bifidobacterium sp.]
MTRQGGGALTIVLVMDALGGLGNGTSNSAWQYARELTRQGHHVRVVGIGSPRYPARVHRVPFVSWVAAKQRMQFAKPDVGLFERAFRGADVVHIYMPFAFGRCALRVAREMGIPVTAGFHLQPENITYSAGPLRYVPGVSTFLYWLFRHWLYSDVRHVHAPTRMIADQLRSHGYDNEIHVISNGFSPMFSPRHGGEPGGRDRGRRFRIVASGRLTHEKDHITLIRAVARCRHAADIDLTICGTGPLNSYLRSQARRLLPRTTWSIGFHSHDEMPGLLRACDIIIHPSIVDIESLSVLEGIACGLVPVIAESDLSAARQFALTDESLFPARDVQVLADRIDWWVEHAEDRRYWAVRYADEARSRYSIEHCVDRFVDMERTAIADSAIERDAAMRP